MSDFANAITLLSPASARRKAGGTLAVCSAGVATLLLAMLSLPVFPVSVQAHAVYIFAWADGTRICTQSYFSKSRRVKGGEVSMADSRGQVLYTGRSNSDGELCFTPPGEAQDLTFTVAAGQGHQAQYLFPAAEVRIVLAAKAGGEKAPAPQAPAEKAAPKPEPSPLSEKNLSGQELTEEQLPPPGSHEALRTVIQEELRQQLGPIRRALAEQNEDRTPKLRDIIGGLGWIIGLAGAGALYSTRKKRN